MRKNIRWVGSARRDLRKFPEDVKQDAGTGLMWAQCSRKHPDAKPFKRNWSRSYGTSS